MSPIIVAAAVTILTKLYKNIDEILGKQKGVLLKFRGGNSYSSDYSILIIGLRPI